MTAVPVVFKVPSVVSADAVFDFTRTHDPAVNVPLAWLHASLPFRSSIWFTAVPPVAVAPDVQDFQEVAVPQEQSGALDARERA